MIRLHTTIRIAVLFGSLASAGAIWADEADRQIALEINEANGLLRAGDVDAALKSYRQLQDKSPPSADLSYNTAVAQYRKGDMTAAQKLFDEVASGDDDALAAKARYNVGNCNYAAALQKAETDHPAAIKGLENAIEHYRGALDIDANDADSRANIELASSLIDKLREQDKKKQEQQEKQKQEQQKNQQQQQQQDQQQQPSKSQDAQKEGQSQQEQKQNKPNDEQKQNSEQKDQKQNAANQPNSDQQQKTSEQEKKGQSQDQKQQSQQKDQRQQQKTEADKEKGSQSKQTERQQKQQTQNASDSSNDESRAKKQPQPSEQQQQSQAPKLQQQNANRQPSSQQKPSPQRPNQKSPDQPADDKEQKGSAAPKGSLAAADKKAGKNDPQSAQGADKPELLPDGAMTVQEAEKMLQAIRDQEMVRRLRRQAAERNSHAPVDRDW